ncbi:hypothetical protein LCGC14_1696770 [marine sediment metagenome]|uniref:Uncharacterized protein n=1 Tax=marine sediment metagenome TaxID=412755 RepID=A0A0F9I6S9_9ZZZZ
MLLFMATQQGMGAGSGVTKPRYKFVINPITVQLDRVVNKLEILETDFLDKAVPFVLSNAILEDVLFQYDSVNDRLKVANIVIDKASGNGIYVDRDVPTFGFADLLGDQFTRNTGATKPTLTSYNGVINAWKFAAGKEAYLSYHIGHDYVPSTDVHLHIHWSQKDSALVTGGTLVFKYTAIYAKGHNQVSGSTFEATPITATFSTIDLNDGASGLNIRQQHITEVTISGASATSALFDRDNFEPDGVIELTFEMDVNNLTVSGGGVPDPFIHFVDIHYQTTGIIGTKALKPDFYA